MSTYDKILKLTDTLIQQRGFLGFSYADLEKGIGIRKASIHHYFPSKNDLGMAYCEYKIGVFGMIETDLLCIPPGALRLRAYLDAFKECASRGEMCGVYAMLSDCHQFSPELQKAVSHLAQNEMRILEDVLAAGQNVGEISCVVPPDKLAIIVCSALKGALMINQMPPHEAYADAVNAIMLMLDTRNGS